MGPSSGFRFPGGGGDYLLFSRLWRRSLLLLDERPLLLLDDQLPYMQPSDLELLYVEALYPGALHDERPDHQGADRYGTEACQCQCCGQPREGHLPCERRLLWRPLFWCLCSAHLMHRRTPFCRPLVAGFDLSALEHDAIRTLSVRTSQNSVKRKSNFA